MQTELTLRRIEFAQNMARPDWCECSTCGYRWQRGTNGDHSCAQQLKQELEVTDKLLAERQRVLDAIPKCEAHGPCVPHALEWIADVKSLLVAIAHDRTESEARRKRAEELMGHNVKVSGG